MENETNAEMGVAEKIPTAAFFNCIFARNWKKLVF
jgi:hypothetical protein